MAADLLQPRIDLDHLDDLTAAYSMMMTGGWVSASAGAEATTFRVTGMSGYVDRLLAGLERIVGAGTYSKTLFEVFRDLTVESLGKSGVQDTRRFAKALRRAVFGPSHPYTTAPFESAESISNIDTGDLASFKKQHYRAANATLVIAGKFDMDLVEKHVRWNFEHWAAGDGSPAAVSSPSQRGDEPMYIGIDSGTSAQVGVLMAYPTPVGIGESYAARRVMIEMVEARMSVVREVLGASYGINASVSTRRGPGMVFVSGDVDAPRAGQALAAMREALQSLRDGDEGFDADFVLARRQVVQRLLADTADSASVARELAFIARHGLPADFYDDLAREVAALTPDDVHALIADELAPNRETIVCSGERETVENAFAAAGITSAGFLD
jgi:predicted Zn-dependent peptidase